MRQMPLFPFAFSSKKAFLRVEAPCDGHSAKIQTFVFVIIPKGSRMHPLDLVLSTFVYLSDSYHSSRTSRQTYARSTDHNEVPDSKKKTKTKMCLVSSKQ